MSPVSPVLAGEFFTTELPGLPQSTQVGHKVGSLLILKQSLFFLLCPQKGLFPQRPFQNTLELSACPDRWEMWKDFAGILVPFLPVSYHNSPIWGPLPHMYTILLLWEQSALLFHIGCLPPCLQHLTQFCSPDYFLQLPGQLPICDLGLISIPSSLQLSHHLLQCTKYSDGPCYTVSQATSDHLNISLSYDTLSPEPLGACTHLWSEGFWSQTSGMRKIS